MAAERVTRIMRCALLMLAAAGCGVAGQPLPPGPVPPSAPTVTGWRATPDAIELIIQAPTADLDGAPMSEPLTLAAHRGPDCQGAPLAHGPTEQPMRLPPLRVATSVRVVAARGGHAGPPSAPVSVRWTPPPPAPEAPLAFVDARGTVQLSWLPPEAPRVVILRDGARVAEVDAGEALWSDAAPPGAHRYQLVGQGPRFRTAPSPAAVVEVPER